MLEQNNDETESESGPAAKVRVKSEEFAQALATIEARKMEEARRLEGTLVLGEAVTDLQLDLTPEEVLAEVEQNRRLSASASLYQPKASHWPGLRERRFTWRVVLSAAILGTLTGWLMKPSDTVAGTPSAPLVQPTTTTVEVSPAPVYATVPKASQAPPATPMFPGTPLSKFPDEKQVYCTSSVLMSLPGNTNPLVNVLSDARSSAGGNVWPLVKHHGILYVHAWVPGRPSAKQLRERFVLIGNMQSAIGEKDKPNQMTFRVDKAQWEGGASNGGWAEVFVEGAKIDSHAWEKW